MNSAMSALVVIGIVLLVILICREVTCWYFKLSAIHELLVEIRDLLKARNQPADRRSNTDQAIV